MKKTSKSVLPCFILFAVLAVFSCDADASVPDDVTGEEDPSYPKLSWFEVVEMTFFNMPKDRESSFDIALFLGDLWIGGQNQTIHELGYVNNIEELSLNINRSRFSKRRFKPDNDCEIWQIIFGMSSMIA